VFTDETETRTESSGAPEVADADAEDAGDGGPWSSMPTLRRTGTARGVLRGRAWEADAGYQQLADVVVAGRLRARGRTRCMFAGSRRVREGERHQLAGVGDGVADGDEADGDASGRAAYWLPTGSTEERGRHGDHEDTRVRGNDGIRGRRCASPLCA
jgi:hypothetical protein